MSDDFAGDISTVGTLTLGSSVNGVIERDGDADWFRFTATAGQTIRFERALTSALISANLFIYDANGVQLDWTPGANGNFFTFSASGTYFLGVRGLSSLTGAYTINSTILTDDHAPTFALATAVTRGQTVLGNLNFVNDLDMFSFTVAAGEAVSFQFLDLPDAGTIRYQVFDSWGASLGTNTSGISTDQNPFFAERGGTYFIRVDSVFSNDLGTYSFRVNSVVDDFPDDTSSTTTLLVGGAPVTMRHHYAGDFDVVRVQINSTGLVRFETSGVSPITGVYAMGLYDANGILVDDFVAAIGGEGFNFNFTQTGTYFLGIEKFRPTNDGLTFTVTATALTDDSIGLASTTRTVPTGSAVVSGVLNYNQDTDAFRIPLGFGPVLINVDSPDFAHALGIYTASGTLISQTTGPDQSLRFDMDWLAGGLAPQELYLVVSGRNPSDRGAYSIQTSTFTDDYTGAARGTLVLESSVTGVADFENDVDTFRISAVAGQQMRIALTPTSPTAQTAFSLFISSAAAPGTTLARTFVPTSSPELLFSVPTTGLYEVRVQGLAVGGYTLAAGVAADDYAGNASTTGTIAIGGTVTGAITVFDTTDWFRFEAVAGDRVRFESTFAVAGAAGFPSVEILRSNGSIINDGIIGEVVGGNRVSRSYVFQESGTFFIQISTPGTPALQSAYSLSATRVPDDWAGSTATTGVLTIGGPAVTGAIDLSGDTDWFAVNLVAGQGYVFNMAPVAPGGVPGTNPGLKLFTTSGAAISVAQPRGLTELVHIASYTGIHYISASSGTPGSTYSIVGAASFGNPLHAISTGKPLALTGPYPSPSQAPSRVVDLYFARAGDTILNEDALPWAQADIDAVMNLVQAFSAVANITFRVTSALPEADISLFRYADNTTATTFARGTQVGNPIPTLGVSTGFAELVGAGLAPGGLGAAYILNALGFALGLSLPHDPDPNTYRMPGVTGQNDTGLFAMNQGINTIMSYNDGWVTAPFGAPTGNVSGYQMGPMALDIAALQAMYGARTDAAGGNTTYQIADANTAGVGWRSIWDTGGVDQIVYAGNRDAVINLQPAALTYSQGGGGNLSYATGVHGGFTIASGVVVETAISGGGNDTLIGNSVGNLLAGQGGNDRIEGWGGNDWMIGGTGDDTLVGGAGYDTAEIASLASGLLLRQGAGRGLMATSADGADSLIGMDLVRLSDGSSFMIGGAEVVDRRFGDFNGDGRADIGFRSTTGQYLVWSLNGSTVTGASVLGQPGAEWRALGEADFDGNGRDEVLWRNSAGALAQWRTDGTQVTLANIFDSVTNDWMVADLGDYTGDGKADILWRNAGGTVAVWAMNGLVRLGDGNVTSVGWEWQVAGSADLNGDGRAEVLWRNESTGLLLSWNLVGATLLGTTSLGVASTDWDISAVADVGGDGRADIIWRNNRDGSVAVWQMNSSGTLQSAAVIGGADLGWTIQGAGDFNGDGRSDLMWTRADGTTAFWFLNGNSVVSTAIGANAGTWLAV